MIKEISITNIKGISSKIMTLDILPNKPSLLIAPNGFGKSSITTGFNSMNRERINLADEDFHLEDKENKPRIGIVFKNEANQNLTLFADKHSNSISNELDWFVINSLVIAKGIGRNYGGRTLVSASLKIDDIILVDRIPELVNITSCYLEVKSKFLFMKKILPNLEDLLKIEKFWNDFLNSENLNHLEKLTKKTNKKLIIKVIEDLKIIDYNTARKNDILMEIENNYINTLEKVLEIEILIKFIGNYTDDSLNHKKIQDFLFLIQILELFEKSKNEFKKFCKRKEYECEKKQLIEVFSSFNTTRFEFKPIERKNNLVLPFPKVYQISNGQRDVMCFIAMLNKAKRKLKKRNSILIIDEVFDYLDEANLIAVQYYISNFIQEYKSNNKNIYPLIMTHLDPKLFNGYVFGKQHKIKHYYLSKSNCHISENFKKLLKERNKTDSPLKTCIEKYFLHYHCDRVDKENEFDTHHLRKKWGKNEEFYKYIYSEVNKYIECDNIDIATEYDPAAVCCGVRIKIEEIIFNKLPPSSQTEFLSLHGTNEKLKFSDSFDINIPETFFYLE